MTFRALMILSACVFFLTVWKRFWVRCVHKPCGMVWNTGWERGLKQLCKAEELCSEARGSGTAPTSCAIVVLENECVFVYTVSRGFSDANGKNLYISSVGLDWVCTSHPTNLSCCCLRWFRLSSFAILVRLLEPKTHIVRVHLLSNFPLERRDGFTTAVCWSKDRIIGVMQEGNRI